LRLPIVGCSVSATVQGIGKNTRYQTDMLCWPVLYSE